eukprot:s260_g21.t1
MLRHAIDINPNRARQCMNSHGLPTFTNKRLSWDCAEVKDILHPFASRSRFRNSTTCTYRTRDQPHAAPAAPLEAQHNARNHNMGPPPPWDVAAQAFSSSTSRNMCGNVKTHTAPQAAAGSPLSYPAERTSKKRCGLENRTANTKKTTVCTGPGDLNE